MCRKLKYQEEGGNALQNGNDGITQYEMKKQVPIPLVEMPSAHDPCDGINDAEGEIIRHFWIADSRNFMSLPLHPSPRRILFYRTGRDDVHRMWVL